MTEAPIIEPFHTKEVVGKNTNILRGWLNDNHHKSTKVGENEFHIHGPNEKLKHVYYHKPSNEIHSVSVIDHHGEHSITDKGKDTNSDHIKNFLVHHTLTHGSVSSSNTNTPGSRKLWSDMASLNHKQISMHHLDTHTKTEHEITPDYLSKNSHKIWNTSEFAKEHKIVMRKHDEIQNTPKV